MTHVYLHNFTRHLLLQSVINLGLTGNSKELSSYE